MAGAIVATGTVGLRVDAMYPYLLFGLGARTVAIESFKFAGTVLAAWLLEKNFEYALQQAGNLIAGRSVPEQAKNSAVGALSKLHLGCRNCADIASVDPRPRPKGAGRISLSYVCPTCEEVNDDIELSPAELVTHAKPEFERARQLRREVSYSGSGRPVSGEIISAKITGVGLFCNKDVRNRHGMGSTMVRMLAKGESVTYLGIASGTQNTVHLIDPVGAPDKKFLFADSRDFYSQVDGLSLPVSGGSYLSGPLRNDCLPNSVPSSCG